MRFFLPLLAMVPLVALAEPKVNDWPEETPRTPRQWVPLYNNPNPDIPLPQDALLVPNLQTILDYREDMQFALVAIDQGEGNDNAFWEMSKTALTVFLNRLATWDETPVPEDTILAHLAPPEPRYQGILVLLQTVDGRRFLPLRIFNGQVLAPNGSVIAQDRGRRMEYWLFGTARIRRDQLLGSRLMPVFTFEQCRVLGQRIVDTTPRQCLLADNNLLLETDEKPTLQSARLTTFAECLRGGAGLIYTFPRRCVAAGGRVFTEPPQVYDNPIPADAPIARKNSKRLATNATISATAPKSVAEGLLRADAAPSPTTQR